ncbi:MAG: UDP-N-acetylglucosamine--N-acetylmuramyl-(pentapeptide) pyrophosphoryl-undecaprenol N-acetylglucosamine transferase, partial [Polaribacter sp.]
MKPFNILISGGGTGGHIYPAIAIANELKLRYPTAKILFVGAKDKMEMEKVPQAGYEIEGLWIAGIQRKLTFSNLLFPIKLLVSLWKARKIIKKFKPNIAIGTGGFASGPTLIMANRRGVPTLIQEQNSFPGITNKLLSKKAKK